MNSDDDSSRGGEHGPLLTRTDDSRWKTFCTWVKTKATSFSTWVKAPFAVSSTSSDLQPQPQPHPRFCICATFWWPYFANLTAGLTTVLITFAVREIFSDPPCTPPPCPPPPPTIF